MRCVGQEDDIELCGEEVHRCLGDAQGVEMEDWNVRV